MSQQLEKCANEKEKYRILGEQLHKRITANNYNNMTIIDDQTSPEYTVTSGAHMLAVTNDQNKLLTIQVSLHRRWKLISLFIVKNQRHVQCLSYI